MKKIKGFTLLELLVVIGIIGVLVALATVAYTATQKSGRNSRRKQDMIAIQSALEQYYAANGFVYPDGNANCKTATLAYMKSSWPEDPTNKDPYLYTLNPICTTTSYCICALMEGGAGGNSGAGCDFAGAKTHYCVQQLQ